MFLKKETLQHQENSKMFLTNSEKNVELKIIIDSIILIITAVVVSLFYIDVLTPFRRGFFCDDDTIRYPHHESTVTDLMLYVVSCMFGYLTILFSELTQKVDGDPQKQLKIFHWRISHKILQIFTSTYIFLFGACITDILTNFIKYILGRLRPNFIDVCQPNINCTSDPHRYVENYICMNSDLYEVTDSRLSFPSGHSSCVAFTMLFSMIYLHKRMICSYSNFVKPILQIIMFLWASFTEVSRIRDNKHHWSDITGGTLLGLAVCYATLYIRPHIFTTPSSNEEQEEENSINISVLKNLNIS